LVGSQQNYYFAIAFNWPSLYLSLFWLVCPLLLLLPHCQGVLEGSQGVLEEGEGEFWDDCLPLFAFIGLLSLSPSLAFCLPTLLEHFLLSRRRLDDWMEGMGREVLFTFIFTYGDDIYFYLRHQFFLSGPFLAFPLTFSFM
jgi:hypothetical protein